MKPRVMVALLLGLSALTGYVTAESPRVSPRAYLEHVRYLASNDLEGRGNGTPGLEKAAEYIARQFRASGLEPAGDRGSFFQTFEIITGISIGSGNILTVQGPAGATSFQLGRDYELLSVSSPSDLPSEGPMPLVFAGYGIAAATQRYDDYAGLDVKGKAVLIFTHEPQENDPASPFDGTRNTLHSEITQKALVARSRGARLVLVVDDPLHEVQTARYRRWMQAPQAEEFGIPVLQVSRERMQQALGGSVTLQNIARQIEADLMPRSSLLPEITAAAVDRTTKIRRPVRNVVGILKGQEPKLDSEAIVIGAHYDHLGRSARFSLAASSTGQIHHGADDNASGTAAVIEMAKSAAADRNSFPRSLVFVTFAGEEMGLLGSSYYVNHPAIRLEQTVAMINLDMVGRSSGRMMISGVDSASSFDEDLKAAQAGLNLSIKTFNGGAGAGASDDSSFLLRKIPSIGFFSGFHQDYHRPSDTWEKIDAAGGAAVADFALALARQIASRAERPDFKAPPPPAHGGTSGGDAPVSGYGPYFGSIPDFSGEGEGVRFADIREDSPAAKAGLRRGDVMVSFGGMTIRTIYDFTFALREKRPGDRVEVSVLRGGEKLTVTVELTNRP